MSSNGVESPGDSGCDSNGLSPSSHNVPTTSTFCESTPSEIFAKLQDTYEKLLQNVDENAGEDALRMKVGTLQQWVKDLGEQNMILVETAEQLEKEATERVALLEDRIRQTSQAALKYMTKLEEYDSHVQDMADQKINLVSMSLSQEHLQTRVSNLQNDITNLMELMRRASVTGSWALDGLKFKEIMLDDSFLNVLSQLRPRGSIALQAHTVNDGSIPVDTNYHSEESKTLECGCKVKVMKVCCSSKEHELCSLRRKFQEVDALLISTLKENENLNNILETRKKQLMLNDKEIEVLKKSLLDLENSYKDERAALTAEVAEKHDEIRSLNEKNKQLEKRFWDANMQTQLKDDIIKQMRKDIKQLKAEMTLECGCDKLSSGGTKVNITDDSEVPTITDVLDARILEEQTHIRIIHSVTESGAESTCKQLAEQEHLKQELDSARKEIATLKLNQKSKEHMLENHMEMFRVQQDSLNMTQSELKETQERLAECESLKQALQETAKELDCRCASEKAARKALEEAEKRNEEQQITIRNLQQALLSTKHQLEELQGRGTTEVSANSGRTWGWLQTSRSNPVTKTVVHDV